MDILNVSLMLWNVMVLFLYGADKLRAKKGGRRISEKTLITAAFLVGGVGAMFGMIIFNHKTSKIRFRVAIPLSVLFNVLLVSGLKQIF